MSDIEQDYFEEAKKLAQRRQEEAAAVAVDAILGEQGKILLEKFADLKTRGIGFSYTPPELDRGPTLAASRVKIDLYYASQDPESDVSSRLLMIYYNDSAVLSIGETKGMRFDRSPNWGHDMAIEIASEAIEAYGVDKEPKARPAPTPEV